MNKLTFTFLLAALLSSLTACRNDEIAQITYAQLCSAQTSSNSKTRDEDRLSPFKLNPNTLREQLLKENSSVLLGINQVHQAKDQVNISRAQLLPQVNLSALLYAAGSPTFTTSMVDIMLPFLVPTNWIKYRQSKSSFAAQIESLKALRMNTYASAYSLSFSILSDQKLLQILASQIQDLLQIENLVEKLYKNGTASKADLDRAQGQRLMAQVNLSKVQGLVDQEISSLKHALGLPIKTTLALEEFSVTPSDLEEKTVETIYEKSKEVSPELQQMFYLKKAAQEEIRAQQFVFIGGTSIHSPSFKQMDDSVAFDNISVGTSFNLSYAQFPIIELSENRYREIILRAQEIERELADRSEYSWGLVREAKQRDQISLQAEASWRSVYERDLIRYKFGQVDLQTVLISRSQLNNALIESLRSQTQLSLNRIVLHRLLSSDQFDQVKNCKPKP